MHARMEIGWRVGREWGGGGGGQYNQFVLLREVIHHLEALTMNSCVLVNFEGMDKKRRKSVIPLPPTFKDNIGFLILPRC